MNNVYRFRRLKWAGPNGVRLRLRPRRRARWPFAVLHTLAALAIVTLGAPAATALLPTISNPAAPSLHFDLCRNTRVTDCVIDGDTIRWQGTTIRLEDIDAPEIRDYRCDSELALGNRATSRLRELLNSGPVEILYTGGRDEDRYGRKLRIVAIGQTSIGNILVAEGLARHWDGARRGWCA